MPSKNKKIAKPTLDPVDIVKFVGKAIQDSVISVFWESVDRIKQEIKVRIDAGLQMIISSLVIITGLIFVLAGVSYLLDEIFGVNGIGYIITGVLVVIGGIYLAEKAKKRKRE